MTAADDALELVGSDPRAALLAATTAAKAARRDGDPVDESTAHRAASLALRELGQLSDAQRRGRAAVRAAIGGGATEAAATARMSLAFVLLERGRVTPAIREADLSVTALTGLAAARAQCQRAMILQRIGRLDEALAAFAAALPVLRRRGDSLWEARALNNRGLLHAYRGGALPAADADLRRARELHLAHGRPKFAADVEWNLGFVAARRGDVPTALERFSAAETVLDRHGAVHPQLRLDRAEVLLSAGLTGEARRYAELGIAATADAGQQADHAEGLMLLARVALAEDDPGTARDAARAARVEFAHQGRAGWALLARFTELRAAPPNAATRRAALLCAAELAAAGWRTAELDARLTAARAAAATGELAVAREQLRLAAAARRSAAPGLRVRAWHATALLRLEDGDRPGALAALRAGLAVVESRQAAVGATEFRVHLAAYGRRLADLGLSLATAGGDARTVLRWAERWRARSSRLAPARPPSEPELAEALVEVRRLSAELTQAALAGERVVRRRGRALRAAEERVVTASRAARSPLHRPDSGPPSTVEIADALGDSVLVEFVDVAGRLSAVTICDGRFRWHAIGATAELAEQIEATHFVLRRVAAGFDTELVRSAGRTTAAVLDRTLFGPLCRDIADRPLVLVPTGVLHAVPWGLLPGLTDRPHQVAPSAAAWLRAHRLPTRAEQPTRMVLAAGPGLPGAHDEVRMLAQQHPDARVLTGADATAAAVLSAVDGADVVHLAAHGDLRADNPLFSALRLADGPLTVYDLERLTCPPGLVVLSACHGGGSAVRAGDELTGLSAAFLALGTRTVVAAVTPVHDRAVVSFGQAFHERRRAGLSPARALAAARAGMEHAAFTMWGA